MIRDFGGFGGSGSGSSTDGTASSSDETDDDRRRDDQDALNVGDDRLGLPDDDLNDPVPDSEPDQDERQSADDSRPTPTSTDPGVAGPDRTPATSPADSMDSASTPTDASFDDGSTFDTSGMSDTSSDTTQSIREFAAETGSQMPDQPAPKADRQTITEREREIADQIEGVDPENVVVQNGEFDQEATRRRIAREQIAEENEPIDPSDIASLQRTDAGFIPELTREAERDLAKRQIIEKTQFTADDIAGVRRTEDGFQPILTPEAERELAQDRIVEQTALREDDIAAIEETEDGFQPVLTEEFRSELEAAVEETQIGQSRDLTVNEGNYVGPIEDLDQLEIPGSDGVTETVDPRFASDSNGLDPLDALTDLPVIDGATDAIDSIVPSADRPEEFEFENPQNQVNAQRRALPQLEEQLEEQTGEEIDLDRADVLITEQDGQPVATLSDSGQETVASETAPFADTPVVGSITRAGAELRQDELRATDPIANRFDEITPDREDILGPLDNIPGSDAVGTAASVTGLTGVGTAVGQSSTAAAGTGLSAASATGIGTVATGVSLVGLGFQSGDVDRSDFQAQLSSEITPGTGITEQELDVGGDTTDQEELSPEDVLDQSELTQPEQSEIGQTEVEVPTGDIFDSELDPADESSTTQQSSNRQDDSVVGDEFPLAGRDFPSDPAREFVEGESPSAIANTSPLQQGRVREEQQEEDEVDQLTEDDFFAELPEIEQPGPSVREQIQRDDLFVPSREFPTGGSAVIGNESITQQPEERLEEVQQPFVGTDDIVTDPVDVLAGPPDLGLDTVGLQDEAQSPIIDTGVDVLPRQEPTPLAGTAADVLVDVAPVQLQALDQVTAQRQQTEQLTDLSPGLGPETVPETLTEYVTETAPATAVGTGTSDAATLPLFDLPDPDPDDPPFPELDAGERRIVRELPDPTEDFVGDGI